MSFKSTTVLMLVSAPSDVPEEHLRLIARTVNQWNLSVGRQLAITVVPVSWTDHAVPAFGDRPQAVLNEQIVDASDMVLAIFSDRLGTPTGEAESGTDEEITRMHEAGNQVSILLNNCPRAPISGPAVDERKRLDTYIAEIQNRALTLSYTDTTGLVQHVNNILAAHTGKIVQQAEDTSPAPAPSEESRGVWPTVIKTERQEAGQRGQWRTTTNYSLRLRNGTGGPAHNVSFVLEGEDGQGLDLFLDQSGPIAVMPPDEEMLFPMLMYMGVPQRAECTVTWHDTSGEAHETRATVNLH